MRLTTALTLLAALAGCGGSGPQPGNAATARPAVNAAAAPDPAPAANRSAAAGDEASGLAGYREVSLRGCIGGARDAAPAGTPVEQQCACAVDRMMAGRTLAQLEAEERSGEHDRRFQSTLGACIDETGGRAGG